MAPFHNPSGRGKDGGRAILKSLVWPLESCCLSLGLIVKNSWWFSKKKKCLNCFPLCKRSLFWFKIKLLSRQARAFCWHLLPAQKPWGFPNATPPPLPGGLSPAPGSFQTHPLGSSEQTSLGGEAQGGRWQVLPLALPSSLTSYLPWQLCSVPGTAELSFSVWSGSKKLPSAPQSSCCFSFFPPSKYYVLIVEKLVIR